MAWPLVTLAVKLLSAKFIKGAIFGIGRYLHKVFSHEPVHEDGRPMEGLDRVNHALRKQSVTKENLIFLLMMLGNFFFGLQELCLWLWGFAAKRMYNEFRTGMPSALQDPEDIAREFKEEPWPVILPALTRWLMIASLVHWPSPRPPGFSLTATDNSRWIEVRYGKHVYLIRTDRARDVRYAGMRIRVDGKGWIEVSATIEGSTLTHSLHV